MSLTREQLVARLVDEFGLDADELAEDGSRLFSGGLLDSFSMLELVSYIEQTTGVKFRPAEFNLENLDSVDRIMRFVTTRVAAST